MITKILRKFDQAEVTFFQYNKNLVFKHVYFCFIKFLRALTSVQPTIVICQACYVIDISRSPEYLFVVNRKVC